MGRWHVIVRHMDIDLILMCGRKNIKNKQFMNEAPELYFGSFNNALVIVLFLFINL